MNDPKPLLVSISEARRLLGGISRWKLYRMAGDGEITLVRLGGRSLANYRELERLVSGLEPAPIHPMHRRSKGRRPC